MLRTGVPGRGGSSSTTVPPLPLRGRPASAAWPDTVGGGRLPVARSFAWRFGASSPPPARDLPAVGHGGYVRESRPAAGAVAWRGGKANRRGPVAATRPDRAGF